MIRFPSIHRLRLVLGAAGAVLILAALSAAAPAAEAAKPNLLVVVTDDQRAEGTLGVMPKTVDWLGDRGKTFTDAYATTPLCCPSRVSIFTGQYAHNHGVFFNQDPNKMDPEQSVQRRLQDAGYTTGIVGKYLLNEPIAEDPPHWDQFAITGGQYFGAPWNLNGRLAKVPDYSTTFTAERATRFIRDRDRQEAKKPWFLYVATGAPHGPARPEARYRKADVGPFPKTPAVKERDLSDKPPFWQDLIEKFSPRPGFGKAAAVREAQLRTLMSVDDLLGDLRRQLRRTGELEKTLVIFSSDNGLLWGEHGGVTIKDMPWLESSKIPMLLSWPGEVEPGGVDRRIVANIDIAPTLLDAAKVKGRATMDGRSMLGGHRREDLLLEYGGLGDRIAAWGSLTSKPSQYTAYQPVGPFEAFEEYYDLRGDPFQLENLLGNATPADDPSKLAALRARLTRYLTCAGSSCP